MCNLYCTAGMPLSFMTVRTECSEGRLIVVPSKLPFMYLVRKGVHNFCRLGNVLSVRLFSLLLTPLSECL